MTGAPSQSRGHCSVNQAPPYPSTCSRTHPLSACSFTWLHTLLPLSPLPLCIGAPHLPASLLASSPAHPILHFPRSRIYEILPQRIQQWQQSPCLAEEHGKKLLERIRREQQSARTRLQEMERRFHELEAIILRAKQQAVREDEESNEGDSDDTDLQIFCVSCGHPINPRVALRHMERCYAKVRVSARGGGRCVGTSRVRGGQVGRLARARSARPQFPPFVLAPPVREPDVLWVHVPHPHRGVSVGA